MADGRGSARGARKAGAREAAAAAVLAARAQAIGGEAAGRFTGAMRELVYAAAGLTGFAVETARDVVQFLVRRGQMAQDEGERLLREAEAAYGRRVAAGRVPQPAEGPALAAAPAKRARKRAAKRAAKRADAVDAAAPSGLADDAPSGDRPATTSGAKRVAKAAGGRAPAKKAVSKRAGAERAPVPAGQRGRGGGKSGAGKRAE